MATPAPFRRYDLDWLRVFGVLIVFFYHLARVFDPFWWHIKNPRLYPLAGLARLLAGEWMMPLLFLVSGAAAFYALRSRDARAFITDRAARLLVPFLVGVFTHIAVQVYLERLSFGQFAGSFLAFYPHYFDGFYGFGGNFAWMGLHLWFLPALFLYSLLLLPFFLWVEREDGANLLNRFTGFLAPPRVVYLLALPVVALLAALNPASLPGNRDAGGWSLLIYPFFFLYGYILVSRAGLEESVQRQRWLSLVIAFISSTGVTLIWLRGAEPIPADPGFAALYGFSAWCWLLAIWGFATLHLNFSTPLLRYANDAILPFYVLHQSVMVVVAYIVVRWPVPDMLKLGLIAGLSLAVILAIYHFLIRPFNPARVLFGMRLKHQ